MTDQPDFRADGYMEWVRAAVPGYDDLQAASIEAVAAIPRPPGRVLDLGIGNGETSRRLLDAFPEARITGLDSSPEMVFGARQMGIEVRLARMEDPLPDGPWDLVISVLSVHHLPAEAKRDLFRRIREQSGALILGDVVTAAEHDVTVNPTRDHLESAEHLAEWSGGEVAWQRNDLAVIAARYE